MADEEVHDLSPELPEEPAKLAPEPVSEVTPTAIEEAPKRGWNRRKFLTAAALGTAAATLLNKAGGFGFGPLDALADDHSTDPCTAGDINVDPTGIILNEPCSPGDCSSGKFDAVVRFNVTNSTGTGRYCISLHLPSSSGFRPRM